MVLTLFPGGLCLAANIIIKVIASSYVTLTTSRYTGIHWFILLLTHLFSNRGTEAEGAVSHQQMSIFGVGLQTQADWHRLIDSFFSTFSPHWRLSSERYIWYIGGLCIVWFRTTFSFRLDGWLFSSFSDSSSSLADVRSPVHCPPFVELTEHPRVPCRFGSVWACLPGTAVRSTEVQEEGTETDALFSRPVTPHGWRLLSSSSPFLILSHIFSRVEFLGLITFIKFTRVKESLGEKGAWERGRFLFVCLFLSEDYGSHHLFNRERTNAECPRSLLFRSSHSGSVEMAWLCLLVSRRGCLQLLVTGLLGPREDGPRPFTPAWGVGWSRNYTTLSKHLTLTSPLSLTPTNP